MRISSPKTQYRLKFSVKDQNIEIYLKNDYPIIIRYNVANLGEVKFCLAPKNNDD